VSRVVISVLCHNRLDLTKKCLASVLATVGQGVRIVVTDNASKDGTKEWLKSLSTGDPRIVIRRNEENLGFGVPHNAALARDAADAEFFVVLNNDCVVPPGWLGAMVGEFRKDPKVAVCGVLGGCTEIDERANGRPGPRIEYVEASCMMVRVDVVRKHGLFSPEYRMIYCEDADFGLRMRSLGYRLAIAKIHVPHLRAATVNSARSEVDFEGYRIRNMGIFKGTWGAYLRERKLAGDNPPNQNILVRRRGALGDVILATPVVAALKRLYPKARISVLTDHPEVFVGNPDVEAAFPAPREPHYDTVHDLDMAYERYPLRHVVLAYADQCGVDLRGDENLALRLYPGEGARRTVARKLPRHDRLAILHAGKVDRWAGRQWPLARFEAVAKSLSAAGFLVAAIGNGESPVPAGSGLDARGWPLQETTALMEKCNLFVGVDSAPFHIAQACKTPSAVIFGSIDPALRVVPGRTVAVTAGAPVGCLGCHHVLPAPRTATTSCLRGNHGAGSEPCMQEITIEHVLDAAERALGQEFHRRLPRPQVSPVAEAPAKGLSAPSLPPAPPRPPVKVPKVVRRGGTFIATRPGRK